MDATRYPLFRGERALLSAVAVACVGWSGLGLALVLGRRAAWFSYLVAFAFVVTTLLGALLFLMIHHAAGALWNVVVRRLNEAIVGALPLLALLFVPLAFALRDLYPWAGDARALSPEAHVLWEHRRAYLNPPFFVARACGYFVVWSLVAAVLRNRSFARDRAGSAAPASAEDAEAPAAVSERTLSSAFLPITALTFTFATFDWLMSLDPIWFSTIFGVYVFAGGFVASIGLLTAVAFLAERAGYMAGALRPPHYHALGRLMLAFSIFWAYAAFFQALLIQSADKPDETGFYLLRLDGGFSWLTALVVVVRFVVPIVLLLPRAPKFDGRKMALAGVWILAGHYLDAYWLVAPLDAAHRAWPGLGDLAALAAVGGVSVAYGTWRLRGRALIPISDPGLASSIRYRSPL